MAYDFFYRATTLNPKPNKSERNIIICRRTIFPNKKGFHGEQIPLNPFVTSVGPYFDKSMFRLPEVPQFSLFSFAQNLNQVDTRSIEVEPPRLHINPNTHASAE